MVMRKSKGKGKGVESRGRVFKHPPFSLNLLTKTQDTRKGMKMEKEKDDKILDCGHPPDSGAPASVVNEKGEVEVVQGWTSVLRNGKRICHACDMLRILDCGHHPSPHSKFATGTAHTPDGREICWKCSNARERESLKTADRYFAYYTGEKITTWPGGTLARVTIHYPSRCFGHKVVHFRARDVHGAMWYGTTLGEGMYCKMRKCKGKGKGKAK